MKAPCKDCPERSVMCHSECDKYLAFKEYRKKVAADKIAQNAVYYAMQGLKGRTGGRGPSRG